MKNSLLPRRPGRRAVVGRAKGCSWSRSRIVLCALVLDAVCVTNVEAMESVVYSSRKTAFVEGRNGQFGVGLN